jgi:hypothetical protein
MNRSRRKTWERSVRRRIAADAPPMSL